MNPPQPPSEATDIFSISDQVLAEKFQFIEEIGFGNWGSVWLCRPKEDPSTEVHESLQHAKVAVKVVHRSKTPTTAARVKSLWNEMKIVRTLREDGHPAIIPFYSFIITPSYAMITMAYHPRLIPVEVPEQHSREWFRLLLSGVEFLHRRGVVHNDIKPANILLSKQNVPIIVDFGFAERYDLESSTAFHSNLAYGTPEYLSPERARGLPHDTRKSDMWALGVTFFEVLVGRTPFEYTEGEQFATKVDLEKYWARTMKGKWVGAYKMSKSMERLLKKMILPNADLRITSSEAMEDPYWTKDLELPASTHKKTVSGHTRSPSLADIISPFSTRGRSVSREHRRKSAKGEGMGNIKHRYLESPPGLDDAKLAKVRRELAPARAAQHKRSRSQSKLRVLRDQSQCQGSSKARVPTITIAADLSPIKGSPPATPAEKPISSKQTAMRKENAVPRNSGTTPPARRPAGPRPPLSPTGGLAVKSASSLNRQASSVGALPDEKKAKVKGTHQKSNGVLRNITDLDRNNENVNKSTASAGKESVKALQRVKEWERERERLREIERLRDTEMESEAENVEPEKPKPKEVVKEKVKFDTDDGSEKENNAQILVLPSKRKVSGSTRFASRSTGEVSPIDWDNSPTSPTSPVAAFSGLKQNLRMSIDKTVQSAKSSVLALGRMSTPALTLSGSGDGGEESGSTGSRESWEEAVIRDANCTLPAVREAFKNERVGADNQVDRMTIWMRNVEKVVEETRHNFASTQVLPPVPLAPASKPISRATSRSSRLPRKVLPANKIFALDDQEDVTMDRSWSSGAPSRHSSPVKAVVDQTISTIPSEKPSTADEIKDVEAKSPPRPRRNTVATRSPEPKFTLDLDQGLPSKRKEKSRSHNDLSRSISPIEQLQFEIDQRIMPSPPLRLSALLDSSLFVASPSSPKPEDAVVPTITLTPTRCEEPDDLAASPFHVEPYPTRQQSLSAEAPVDSPTRRHVEGVYDRFLMATSGVKRVGKGYQSDNNRPLGNIAIRQTTVPKRDNSGFLTSRRPLPPPVSSDDLRRAASADELGFVDRRPRSSGEDEGKNTVRLMGAIKAIVTGKQTSRRASRLL
ncbi:hypothetical protein NEOLEDRAFT_916115 [Neolentinus lepideus HHB14362 ss-1]|uniref:Protein kinase domain-containing protein n=1 Tax=Neolentinus lepideus HHB14362 ss-1 TaxID=1314782 RepID=A0A165ULD6_9AGAM|nr:hypothetical protein NEOLEDRAFT_916115 [Neolentinus lepideus HHB14362 ss-1]